MVTNGLEYRGIDAKDEYLTLMATTFPPEAVARKEQAWAWLFAAPFQSQDRKTEVALLLQNGAPIGATIILPTLFSVNGVEERTVLPMGTLMHPDSRGRGMRLLRENMQSAYSSLIIGLPNGEKLSKLYERHGRASITPPRRLRQKIYRPGTMLRMSKRIPGVLASFIDLCFWPISRLPSPAARLRADERIRQVNDFGPDFDAAWDASSKAKLTAQVRNAAFLSWRYMAFPAQDYETFALYRDNELAGYIVLALRPARRGLTGQIVDIFSYSGSDRDFELLIRHADKVFAKGPAAIGEFSFSPFASLDDAARRAGFLRSKSTRPLAFRHEDPDRQAFISEHPEQFHFCRGDHDEDY